MLTTIAGSCGDNRATSAIVTSTASAAAITGAASCKPCQKNPARHHRQRDSGLRLHHRLPDRNCGKTAHHRRQANFDPARPRSSTSTPSQPSICPSTARLNHRIRIQQIDQRKTELQSQQRSGKHQCLIQQASAKARTQAPRQAPPAAPSQSSIARAPGIAATAGASRIVIANDKSHLNPRRNCRRREYRGKDHQSAQPHHHQHRGRQVLRPVLNHSA